MGSARSASGDSGHNYLPSEMAQSADQIMESGHRIAVHEKNRVHDGLKIADPTTPSDQLTGAGGFLDWNVDISEGTVAVNGVLAEITEQADFDVSHGVAVVTNGQSCIAAIVAKLDGSISVVAVKGTAATTGSQRAPTDAVIQAAVGAGKPWVLLGETTVSRTGDLVVSQAHNNKLRPILGITVETDIFQ